MILFGLHLHMEILKPPEAAEFETSKEDYENLSLADGSRYSRWTIHVLDWQSISLIGISPNIHTSCCSINVQIEARFADFYRCI